jgi:hypothetical protein
MGKLTINGIRKLKYSELWTENLSVIEVVEMERSYDIFLKWKGTLYNVSLMRDVEIAPALFLHRHPYKIKLGTFIAGKTIVLNYMILMHRPEGFITCLEKFMEDCSK